MKIEKRWLGCTKYSIWDFIVNDGWMGWMYWQRITLARTSS